jgi:hypothetical protein
MSLIQTPHRFRTKRQLWAYSGLAIETHDSAQYRYHSNCHLNISSFFTFSCAARNPRSDTLLGPIWRMAYQRLLSLPPPRIDIDREMAD